MRVAVLLKGISCAQAYAHWSGKAYDVDYRDSADNISKMLIEPFRQKGNVVDVYCCTYEHDKLHLLTHRYGAKGAVAFPRRRMLEKTNKYVLSMILDGLATIKEDYDLFVVTRFDVNFGKSVADMPFDKNNVNFLCKASGLGEATYNDDTLIIVGGRHLQRFREVCMRLVEEGDRLMHHLLYDKLRHDGLGRFMYDETHEIALKRPFVLFNREIEYRPKEVLLNMLNSETLYTTYRCGRTAVRVLGGGVFEVFKPPGAGFVMHYDAASATTAMRVAFEAVKASGSFGSLVLRCNGDERHCAEGSVDEVFVVRRGANERVSFRFEAERAVHVRLGGLRVEQADPARRIHFVSFYTEGAPHDLCTDMAGPASRYRDAISPYVDTVHFWTPRELSADDKTRGLVAPVEGATPNPYNPGVHNIGFLRWKPYLLLSALEQAAPGEIVYYRDANVAKYPSILDSVHETRALLEMVLGDRDVFVPVENWPDLKMKKNVKREILEDLGRYDNDYLESYGLNSSIVVCRRSEASLRVMREWLDGCMQDRLINYDTAKQQHPEYGWNVQEQSILNAVLRRNVLQGRMPWPRYSLNMRRFTMNDLTKVPRVCVLMAGELRSFDSGDLMRDNALHLINRLNADVFVSAWDHRGSSFNHGSGSHGSGSGMVRKEEIYRLYPNARGANIESYEKWMTGLDPKMRAELDKGFYNNGSSVLCPNTVYPQLYKVWDANRMKVAHEHKHGFKYDLVIRMRPDTWMLEPIPAEFLAEFVKLDGKSDGRLWHTNPPGIYEGERVYDIFYYGDSHTMNVMADAWKFVNELVDMPCDLALPSSSACRVLYLQAMRENIEVIDIPRSIGDVYRGEAPGTYVHKVSQVFNRGGPPRTAGGAVVAGDVGAAPGVSRYMPARYLRG